MNKHALIIVFLAVFQTFSVRAEDHEKLEHFLSLNLEELMEMKVTISTDTKQSITKAPAVVTVITAEDIKATGATNLTDILEAVPGIHVRASHFAFRPLIQFRGANATQTLLMVNGARMKDLMWGFGIFWKGLPANMIERVEIVRGPGSALFGSDASAGVINVITKTAGKIEHSEIGARMGSFNNKTIWMQHGDNWNGFDINLTAELSDTDGHDPSIATDGQSAQDRTFGTSVSIAPESAEYGWRNQDLRMSIAKGNWRLHADFMRHSDLEIGLTGAGVLDPVSRAKDSRYSIELFYDNDKFDTNWELDAELRYQHLEYTSGDGFQERPPGFTDTTGSYPNGIVNQMRSAERRLVLELSGLYTGIENHALKLGAGHTWQDLYHVEQLVNSGTGADGNPLPAGGPLMDISDTRFAFAPEKTRKITHLFLQDIWTLSRDWALTAGIRYDHYSDFGSTLNPRLALVWQGTSKLTAKLLFGQAFRAPSYQELFAITSRSLPNSGLDPERSQTWDLSFSYAATNELLFGLNIFHFKHTDLIRAMGTPRRFQNTGEHSIRGIELEFHWEASEKLRISGNHTHRDEDDNAFRAIDEPDQDAYLRADWNFRSNWNWNLQGHWIGERHRASSDTRPAVDDYFLTDTTLRYSGLKNWEFAASIRNLFDVDAREYTGRSIPNDLPLPKRNFFAEARYQF